MIALALLLSVVMAPVQVHVDVTRRIQTIRPIRTMGTSVDSDPKGKIALLYSSPRLKEMLGTGLGMLTYRLYTELSIQDWHWNPNGTYSDAAHHQGYWTSSADPGSNEITDSFGYRLPHRGDSRDQGDDDNYSRIDDGDPSTYWKSNPYLTHAYTGEPDSANPQWIVIQFLRSRAIDALRIAWTNPYATRYSVQYWTGKGDVMVDPASATWHPFANGMVVNGKGGTVLLRVSGAPVTTKAVRILMMASSNTCDTHGAGDPRNCVGYAVQDVGVGSIDGAGAFRDDVVRIKKGSCGGAVLCTPDPHRQTLMWTSSDDPWHSDADRVTGDQDQPGLDLIARSPITRGLPSIYPVPVFYSTPLNAANEVRYLERRGYPISYIEMGEEVDGQYAMPEDYGALYIQFAKAIHAVDPGVKLGGPIFQGVSSDTPSWPDASGDTSWLHRFVRYLARRGHLQDLAFMSWEHYPYHHCDTGAQLQADLLDEPAFVRRMVDQWHADGLPRTIPLLETEDNFSPDGTDAPQHLYGALWLGDFFGASLASGVSYMTYYQAETEPLGHDRRCNAWGAYNPYIVDKDFQIRAKGAAYYALQLLTQDWALPGDAPHGVYPVTTSLGDDNALVTAYSLKRPDGTWSILVVNKDRVPRELSIDFRNGADAAHFTGKVDVATFGSRQYQWSGNGPNDLPNPDSGLQRKTIAGASAVYVVAPRSLTVFRGKIDLRPSSGITR
jgi:hypothetical protein